MASASEHQSYIKLPHTQIELLINTEDSFSAGALLELTTQLEKTDILDTLRTIHDNRELYKSRLKYQNLGVVITPNQKIYLKVYGDQSSPKTLDLNYQKEQYTMMLKKMFEVLKVETTPNNCLKFSISIDNSLKYVKSCFVVNSKLGIQLSAFIEKNEKKFDNIVSSVKINN
ncbi:MAG: hypothetical protein KDD58_08245 [Bdellovibrionales bacterium]|nr:hypothetical protein [Bdellovibrionales bacterium]